MACGPIVGSLGMRRLGMVGGGETRGGGGGVRCVRDDVRGSGDCTCGMVGEEGWSRRD